MLSTIVLSSALAAEPALNLVPFGVGVYLHDRPVRGAIYSGTQALGVGGLVVGSVLSTRAADEGDDAALERYGTVTTVGVSLLMASYLVSVVDGGRLHELEVQEAVHRVKAWDRAVAVAGGG